ncbi:hypothetical protein RD792_004252 [Penstemon davidsonii]|uniref:WAT1-related protein n=1 Tax=Penstemon davidsonii TaxID=160366 RepID=A0ABR0DI30_9LAMI|nr:hypothetical protein RD792_004252 [Penstemon davidsonii]
MLTTESLIQGELLPFAAMVTVECTNVGLSTIYKAAVSKGLSYHVFMVYSYAISALILLPLSYLFHRKTQLPPLTFQLLGKFFILGILGFTSQYLGYKGIELSNPTLGSAMSNLTPATTFFLAILFRMEKLKLKSISSQAKTIGTVVSMAGALIVVFYKGPMLLNAYHDQKQQLQLNRSLVFSISNWILGGSLLAASYIVVSVWYIFQAKFVTEYPAEFLLVFFYNLSSCIISIPVGIISEPNFTAWKVLSFDVRMISILYSGIMGSAFGTMVHTWGLHVKGPVYVASFRPLSIAIAAILGVIFLGDYLFLGSVVGSIIISLGFYTVLWGKMKEEISDIPETYDVESLDCSVDAPLLKDYHVSSNQNSSAY